MGDANELSLAERLSTLEKRNEEQKAQISALEGALAILLVSQAVCHSDMRPANLLAEFRDYDWKRGLAGGSSHVSAEYFLARADQYTSLLEAAAGNAITSRYWLRSSLGWLDERRHQRLKALEDRLSALALGAPSASLRKTENVG